jgi:GT2 family glycosyltransferase
MEIGIVIVSYNSAMVLGACLKSIPAGYEVIVVDNSSRDESAKIAADAGARVIQNGSNIGFGAACNVGARLLSSSHVLFLNPDAILSQGALAELEQAIHRYPEASAFGPKLLLPRGEKSFRYQSHIEDQGSRYVSPEKAPVGDCCVHFIDGAAMLCNRDAFLSLGGFDENLFLYYEDDDLSYRMKSSGWSLIYVASAVVRHQKKRSSGPSLGLDFRRAWHETRSRILLSSKHGLSFDVYAYRRRALIRLLRAVLGVNIRKAIRYWAIFRAVSRRSRTALGHR